MNNMKKLPKREEIEIKDKWKMEDLYKTDDSWEEDYKYLEKEIEKVSSFKGKISESADILVGALQMYDKVSMMAERVYVYANQKLHEDTGNGKYQEMSGRAEMIIIKLSGETAFMVPEILEISDEKLEEFLNTDNGMKEYKQYIMNIVRQKPHVLSKDMEKLLADMGEVTKGPRNIFSMFNNADIKFGDIEDENKNLVELTHGRYISFLESKDRRVRKEAFKKLYDTYGGYKNTLAATFSANVKTEVFLAKARKYNSSLESALDSSNIPVDVYHNLIDTVHKNLHKLHRYVSLRKKVLGLEELHMYDLYVPMITDVDRKIPYQEGKEIVKKGLQPLGTEYQALLEKGYHEGWIDVYENQGKRSGAYSWGAYGVHPYVLLNYQNNLNNVFTLAHEMGHALHSYYSDENQEYCYAGYKIFVAEVASTCNESLLIHHLIETTENKKEKAYLINYFLEQFRGTLYRQTMFAEFEMLTHGMVEKGAVLTSESLCEVYRDLNKKYFGEDIVVDEEIGLEWARIPHFYTPFYVYQYSTGFSAAIALSGKILREGSKAVEPYKEFLKGGSSMYPIDLLKMAGVDMTTSEPISQALEVFEKYLNQLEELVDSIGV